MAVDAHGLEMSAASAAAVGHYDRAVDELLHFRPAMLDAAAAVAGEDPGCALAAALGAYLRLLSTEPADAADARRLLAEFRSAVSGRQVLAREERHLRAAEAWASGDLHGAGRLLRAIAREHPRDALALAVGHQIDFFSGDALALRDRIAEALGAWPSDHPQYGLLLGMLSFGLEEAGEYERAEETGRRAVERDRWDVWGIHAVAHSYEMRARAEDGLRYFETREGDWAEGNALAVHNWWHRALFALETGDVTAVRGIYDARIHHAQSAGLALELLDASALLWRLLLDGHDETARWQALGAAWGPQVEPAFYAFNDLHAVMAWAAMGDTGRAERLIADRERYLDEPRPGVSNYVMTARIGLPACRAAVAFTKGRYGEAVDLLYPIRHHLNEFGGSHAQRDVLQRTLLEAALRGGRLELAGSLVRERIHAKPDSPYNLRQQGRLSGATGDGHGAAEAARRAAAQRGGARP
jgi:tetratricopeptide (TPR) repeat protein